MELDAQVKKLNKSMKRMEKWDDVWRVCQYSAIVLNVVVGIRNHHLEPFNAFILGVLSVQVLYSKMMAGSRARAEEGRKICNAQMQMILAMGQGLAHSAMEEKGNDWRNS